VERWQEDARQKVDQDEMADPSKARVDVRY
jgi:hypothetical protein